jgi:hypothetical protein
MKAVMAVCLSFLLFSCAAGVVHVAKTENEAVKSSYTDAELQRLYRTDEGFLRQVYSRFNKANIGVYEEGVGLTLLKDQKERKHPYLMVYLRPGELVFDETKTKPEERFAYVFENSVEKYLHYMKSSDMEKDNLNGLAFGIYWPVRDFSRCDTYGGFIEYVHIYFKKDDIQDYLNGDMTFEEAVKEAQVFTSLNSAAPISVRPAFH